MEEVENQTFHRENIDGLTLSFTKFSECTFENCVFLEKDFRGAHFSECSFKNCNLHMVKMDGCHFQDVSFEECKIVGAEFFRCSKKFISPQFKSCVLLGCNFSNLNMKRTSFFNSKVKECHFNETCLAETDFQDSDLEGTLFHHTDLSKANFKGAINYSIDPQTNILKKAHFSAPEVLSLLHCFDIQIS